MMYIIYNNDGSIKEKNLNEFIQQGDNLTKKIAIAIEGYRPTDYTLLGTFKLPNGETTVLTSGVVEDIEGTDYEGVVLTLTEAETALAGIVRMNIQALGENDRVLVSYSVYLPINEGDNPGAVAMMSVESYQLLLAKFNEYTEKSEFEEALNEKVDKINGMGLSHNDFTDNDKTEISKISRIVNHIDSIDQLIPNQASSSNQLADKDFVNSSIATNTANFLGTYNIVSDLDLPTSATHSQVAQAIASKLASLSITPTNNDYVFVAYPDATVSTEYTQFDRYKYNGSSWEYEFTLNNSSFTAQQWAAINSGITLTKIISYDSHLSATNNPHNVTKEQVGLGNVDNKSEATIKEEFTGAIASGNTGFITGGEAYNKLQPLLYRHEIRINDDVRGSRVLVVICTDFDKIMDMAPAIRAEVLLFHSYGIYFVVRDTTDDSIIRLNVNYRYEHRLYDAFYDMENNELIRITTYNSESVDRVF